MRIFLLLLVLAMVVLIPFQLWGAGFMQTFEGGAARAWLGRWGVEWGWLAGIGVLLTDVVLPVPATAVISALGFLYGVVGGGIAGAAGSIVSGMVAYELCRTRGRRAAVWLLGREREQAERIFAGAPGGWLIALSRWLPLLPEMAACMAGFTRMPRLRFYGAMASGSIPMAFTFAAFGAAGVDHPEVALALSAAIPAVLYLGVTLWLRKTSVRARMESPEQEGG